MRVEQVPEIPMFRENTAAFVHELPREAISDVTGDGHHVRVQVLTNAGALDREKQLAVVDQLTALVTSASGDPALARRTWVLLTEAAAGGWGLWGHAHTNEELVAAARGGDRVAPGALSPWAPGAGWPGPKSDRTLCVRRRHTV